MCGIVGYCGNKQAAPILLDGLKRLEYRGYDSSGIAAINDGKINTFKAKGRLSALCDITDNGKLLQGTVGIGHTRWATHGEPSDVNSHPHVSASGKFAVVHNGIIENYLPLRRFLTENGFVFASQTDTEVIAHLLEYYYDGDVLDCIRKTLNKLNGSYALGVICADTPNALYAVRKDSPLVIGLGNGENFIASDMPAILRYTREFILIDEGEIAKVTAEYAKVFNHNMELSEKRSFTAEWDLESAEKGGYPHFMLKEIHEQPRALRDTILSRITPNGEIKLDKIKLSDSQIADISKINIIGCGSAYHAGLVGKYYIERTCRIPVEVDLASEYRYRSPIVKANTLTIIISQSGETADTLAALREAKRLGSRTLAIVNVVGSSIAREADDVLYTLAGPEIAVATTKGYTSQVAALQLLGLKFASALGTLSPEEYSRQLSALSSVPAAVEEILSSVEKIQYISSLYRKSEDTFFIGRGTDYAAAMEGALKLKEISYIHAEAYPAGELKHGTISLVEDGIPVIVVSTDPSLMEKTLSNTKEVKTRGARVIAITTPQTAAIAEEADHAIVMPECHYLIAPLLTAVYLQLFGYYTATARGCDIDKPRNLAKSVTVE